MQSLIQYRNIAKSVRSQNQLRPPRQPSPDLPSDPKLCRDQSGEDSELNTTSPEQSPRSASTVGPIDIEKAEQGQVSPYIVVSFDGPNDRLNPQTWSHGYKWFITCIVGMTGFIVAGASAIDSEVALQVIKDFDVGKEVALLGTTLFMVAFGLGSLVSGPFSEIMGRNMVYIASLTTFCLFTMGAGLSPNIASWLTCRFFAGLFGSPPLTNFGGTTADLWSPAERTYVIPVLVAVSFLGPFLAPVVASFIGPSPLVSWQWTEWLTLILAGAELVVFSLLVPETFPPVLLRWKAQHLRNITGNDLFRSEAELEEVAFHRQLVRSVKVPFKFLFTEPIIDLFSRYLVIIYTILFGFLPGYEFIFGEKGVYGLSQQHTGLCFIGANIGFLLCLVTVWPIYGCFKRRLASAQHHGRSKVVPEERLISALVGAPFLPTSLFWIAWTSRSDISIWSPLAASVFFGFAVLQVFISAYQYIIDSYESLAASALVCMTFSRYVVSGPMVIVAIPMYENLGVHWTLTLLGCLAAVMTPVPFLLYWYGHIARKRSRGATCFD